MVKPKRSAVEAYKQVDDQEKEELIKAYLPLVKKVVHRLSGRLPKDVDLREMLNSGIIGLVDALKKYDPKHETNFSTYAQFRIRGAILDSFRSQDWLPRSLRFKSHRIELAYQRMEQKLGRAATDEEVATELGLSVEELQKMLGEVGSIVMLSFEELGFGHGEERFHADDWLPSKSQDPLNKLLGSEKVGLIARALDRLPEKERLVISLYFYEELNLKEIGEILGVTESRASQIRSRALIRLKNYLRAAV
ncbi:MAG: FliA/WhiG family RNA polymerase sigma factor [SAR324 cluster bacterium]|uniref:FliA/WhiG family RNA polymerase sigma factor n=1 Tax=SAR324 cluster bacterium TaxID=2024889 RepID=A0A7X9FPY5_9DELT|nr:FliA/WhiG family RNA polymerase sigma factor [SAR324 cluster bacterium]